MPSNYFNYCLRIRHHINVKFTTKLIPLLLTTSEQTVFLLHFILSLLPMTYSPARLVVMSLLCFALWLIAVVLYIALTVYTVSQIFVNLNFDF